MADDKQPMQADGGDGPRDAADGTTDTGGAGESGGGAYPNPHTGKNPKGGIMGHGGQTEIDQKLTPGEGKA